MTSLLLLFRAIVTALIFLLVGLAFLPHSAASRLTGLQKFLTDKIAQRRGEVRK